MTSCQSWMAFLPTEEESCTPGRAGHTPKGTWMSRPGASSPLDRPPDEHLSHAVLGAACHMGATGSETQGQSPCAPTHSDSPQPARGLASRQHARARDCVHSERMTSGTSFYKRCKWWRTRSSENRRHTYEAEGCRVSLSPPCAPRVAAAASRLRSRAEALGLTRWTED